jgi:hypothetical protein
MLVNGSKFIVNGSLVNLVDGNWFMVNLVNMVNLVKWFRLRKAGTSIFTNDAFWRVSADTETCGSPLYLAPTGGFC